MVMDKMIWKGDVSGCFTIKAYFNLLEGASPYSVPTKMLWNSYVPSKIVFFFFFLGKVLTLTQLKKKGFHLAGKCPFCRREEEELEQILIYCPSIWGQWTDLLNAFGVSWTCPFFVKDLLQSWLHFPVRKKAKSIWRAIPLILFWAIWEERNRVIFEDATFSTLRQTLCYPFPFYLGWLYSKR